MSRVSPRLRRIVAKRARHRCEYCRLSQTGQEATFHVDHVLPRAAGGSTVLDNLALACVSCSLYKEARRSAVDPKTGRRVLLFHPRKQRWSDHFNWSSFKVAGKTASGRATVLLLRLNRPLSVAIRQEEQARGRHPPPDGR
jgi:hypothetical protein